MADATLNGSGELSGYLGNGRAETRPRRSLSIARTQMRSRRSRRSMGLLHPGDQLALRVIGDSVQGWVYHLGSWQQVASATDTTYRTGKIGVRPRGTTPIIYIRRRSSTGASTDDRLADLR